LDAIGRYHRARSVESNGKNILDRNFSAEAERLRRQDARKRRRRLALFIGATLILGVAALYVWAMTLCGDCGAPPALPPPA
jgi:hypothetical protein